MIRARAAAVLLAVLCGTAAGALAQTGREAFDRKDYAEALRLWQQEAGAGSADAKLALGLMNDLGLGMPRDPEAALAWYLEAAGAGLAEAQFNAAIMLDAGLNTARDLPAAAALYARAGLNGSIRARYNLAVLYQTGEGVPRNLDLARYWLSQVEDSLPAARLRLAEIEAAPRPSRVGSGMPVQLFGAVVEADSGRRGELVWAAEPGPPDSAFLVQVATLATEVDRAGILLGLRRTEGSAIAMPLPDYAGDDLAWRVLRVGTDPAQTAAAPWQVLGSGDPARLPRAHVRLDLAAEDDAAAILVEEVGASLFGGGLWVETSVGADADVGAGAGGAGVDPAPAAQTSVTYFYPEDEEMARAIAAYLPVLEAADARREVPPPDVLPGDIAVRLVGGPQAPEAP
jgi:hypothetical protein